MNQRPASLSSLASRVTRAQDRMVERSDPIPGARARVLAHAARPRRGNGWSLAGFALVGAAAGAALLIGLAYRPLHYELDGLQSHQVDTADVLRAGTAEGHVRFSDGSRVAIAPDAKVRIDSVTAHGARVQLDHGALQARIVHEQRTDWTFRAGPFEVAVIGTSFELQWEDRGQALTVEVHDGAVRVSGCSVAGSRMVAGQRATLRCTAGQPEMVLASAEGAPAQSAPSATASTATVAPSSSQPPREPRREEFDAAAPAQEPTDAAAPDWRALAAKGKLKDAYSAADGAGFEQECGRASARELLDLADGALLSGRVDHATYALMQVRSRHAGSSASTTAAYKLGRIAFDRRGALGDARTWFQVYLQEAPGGALAREAAGRLIEIDVSTGNVAGAKARAQDYLQRWPQGPHAQLAAKLVSP